MPLKTLFLNPPSFENFDGGAGSRWPATREIESYWYPVWLAYPAGMLEGARLLDAPAHHVSSEETIKIAQGYEFLVLYTSTPGFPGDIQLAGKIREAKPTIKIAFVGPHVTVLPERTLKDCPAIDFICRKEFDHSVVEFAQGNPIEEILGISYRKDGAVVHNPDRPQIQDLDALPHVTDVYYRDLDPRRYNVPFLLYPFVSLYTTRGCPAQCTFCLWPQTTSGHAWRKRSTDDVAREMAKAKEYWPWVKEFFFDDDTFNIQKARTVELCAKLKPLNLTWSCTSRVTTDFETLKAMKEAGCRLLIVGYESGDQQILKNIKKGATLERARQFTKDCHKLGLVIHGDFIMGLPGETHETINNTIAFAKELDVETIQVSVAHDIRACPRMKSWAPSIASTTNTISGPRPSTAFSGRRYSMASSASGCTRRPGASSSCARPGTSGLRRNAKKQRPRQWRSQPRPSRLAKGCPWQPPPGGLRCLRCCL